MLENIKARPYLPQGHLAFGELHVDMGRTAEAKKFLAIAVEDQPSRDLLQEMEVAPGEMLFGVFTGGPLPERSVTEPTLFPDVILIFREPLMTACHTVEELEEEIAITVVHELAHF